jgi:hypothetical protein
MPSTTSGKGGFNLVASKRPPPMQIGYNEEGIQPVRQVLYRNFHQVNDDRGSGHIYLVEISRSEKKVFILLFPNFETPEVYKSCHMTEKQATKLMSECGNVFDEFIKKFFIKFDRLQIEGFHTKRNIQGGIIAGAVKVQPPNRGYYNSVSPGKKRSAYLNMLNNPSQT